MEDSFEPWDEQYCKGRRNSRTGIKFHLTHKRSKSENSSNAKSKKGRQHKAAKSPSHKKREVVFQREKSVSAKTPEGDRSKATREDEAIESVY